MFKEVMVDNFSKLMSGTKLQIKISENTNRSKYEKTNKISNHSYIQTDKNKRQIIKGNQKKIGITIIEN